MAEEEPKKEPANIEELVKQIVGSTSEEHGENIAKYEDHYKRANQDKIQNRLVRPALEGDPNSGVKGAYHTSAARIDAEYAGGKVDVKDEEKLHRVLVSYMQGFFEHANPSVMEALPEHLKKPLDELSKDEVKSLYETLAHHFDSETGGGRREGIIPLSGLDEIIRRNFDGEDEVTADMLKEYLHDMVQTHRQGVLGTINSRAHSAYISNLPHGVYAAHVLSSAKKAGKEITPEREADFVRRDPIEIANDIGNPLVKKENPEYKKHGFYDKKTEEH